MKPIGKHSGGAAGGHAIAADPTELHAPRRPDRLNKDMMERPRRSDKNAEMSGADGAVVYLYDEFKREIEISTFSSPGPAFPRLHSWGRTAEDAICTSTESTVICWLSRDSADDKTWDLTRGEPPLQHARM